jgi:hypothetical protein
MPVLHSCFCHGQALSGASQPAIPPAATVVKIGSFTIGVAQTMLTANKATSARHIAKIEDIIATCVQDGSLDIFSLSDLGDHRQGLHAAAIRPADLTVFKPTGVDFLVEGAYMTAWGFKPDATHLGAMNSVTCNLKSFLEPQLVIQVFTVPTCTSGNLHRGDLSKFLIHGNLHIRCPTSTSAVTTMNKTRVLQEAMWQLEKQAELKGSSASQPAVLVLVGDPNLTKQEVEEAIQMFQTNDGADWQNVWHVHTTSAQLSGDIVLVKGAYAKSFDLPFGRSHRDRGLGLINDQHDAIGIELHFHSLSTPRSGASQPAASSHDQARSRASQSASSRERSRSGGGRGSEDVAPHATFADKIKDYTKHSMRPQTCRGAHQPVTSPGATATEVAETVNKDMRSFWEYHPETRTETRQLRSILFARTKHPVPDDLWITGGASGASQPGDQQYVTAVVSETYVLQQLHGVLELRNEWLRQQHLPLHFQMRDKIERPEFLTYAKDQYEMQLHQLQMQAEDLLAGGMEKLRSGKKSRWSFEQQRRCGTPALWRLVSFTGRFEANYLETVQGAPPRGSVGACQPDDQDNTPQEKTKIANEHRGTFRWAEHLDRIRTAHKRPHKRRFSNAELQLLHEFDTGELLREANDATRASGHGRLRSEDGSFQDIGASTGSLLRTVLDDWKPSTLQYVDCS